MDAWDHIRRATADRRSGAVEVTARAAQGVEMLTTRRDLLRAARALLRAHPAMAPLWQMLAAAHRAGTGAGAEDFATRLSADAAAAADGFRWVAGRRNAVVLTHSASSGVAGALARARSRIARVICTTSLPGGEGRAFARQLAREGFETEVVPDAAIAQACARATVALVGSDAITESGVVNKVGTRLVALAARDAGIGCYAIGAGSKLLPARIWERAPHSLYEPTPLELFDAVLTERGPQRPAALRRAIARIDIPRALEELKR